MHGWYYTPPLVAYCDEGGVISRHAVLHVIYFPAMKTANAKLLRMLVHLDAQYEAARKILYGILHFATTNHHWEVQFTDRELPYGNLSFYRDWKPDAIITDCRCHTIDNAAFTATSGRAAVFVNTTPPRGWRRPCAVLESDNAQIGKTAAAFFLHKKLANFAYIGDANPRSWDKARYEAFSESIGAADATVHCFSKPTESSWATHEKTIAGWLKSLPMPCGVFAAYDIRGKHILDACRFAGLSVPEQIQVLGVDDETHICEQTVPTLSSIAPDYEAGGFAAAEFLDGVLRGSESRRMAEGQPRHIAFGIRGVVERMSTTDIYGTAQRITAAKKFIRQYATTQIGVGDVAAAVGVSPRVLQRNFRAVTGTTILDAIQEVRLEKAKSLLRKTTIPVNNLATFCGFSSPSHLKRLFKARLGTTMSAWRTSATKLS